MSRLRCRLPRLQTLFMFIIAVLLFLNIILPARYTVQLVRVIQNDEKGGVPTSEIIFRKETPSVQDERLQQQRAAVELPQYKAANKERALAVQIREDKQAPPQRRSTGGDLSLPVPENSDKRVRRYQEEMRERMKWRRSKSAEEEDELKAEYWSNIRDKKREKRVRDAWYNKDDIQTERMKVNFHDPSQRMAYYKKLRRGLKAGPGMFPSVEARHQRRLEMVKEMWDGWFEEDSGVPQLGGLEQYITDDISPETIEEQLSHCSLALGVSYDHLQSQHDDMKKTSKKLSFFLSAVRSLVPATFSNNFSSPCWYSNQINTKSNLAGIMTRVIGLEGHLQILPNQVNYLARQAFGEGFPRELRCLPHFFLAGFPKSATTSLSEVLFSHPQVSSVIVKETHWWTRAPIISPDEGLLKLNVLRYMMHFHRMAHFATERNGLLSMDGSQSTLWDSNFVFNGHDFCSTPVAISHVLPDAKFIILMREPSERLYSYYIWSCSYKYGNDTAEWPPAIRKDPAGNFHTEVTNSITEFNQCLEMNSLYECANKFTFTNSTKATGLCGQIGFRMVVSIYYIHISKFLQIFPREQFLFLKMEDMSNEPFAFLRQVTKFLEIAPYPVQEIRDSLERKRNRQRAGIEPMRRDTRELLHQFFTPYNMQLARLLNDDRFLWGYS